MIRSNYRGKENIVKRFTLLLLTAVIVLGCNNEYEPVFEETPDERIKKTMEEYRTALLGAPNGWRAILNTGTGPGFLFYFDFNENGTVRMIADFNEDTGKEVMDATYSLKALQRITLSFDTYSYIHLLADPSEEVNGGVNGEGLISDFEFGIESVDDGIIKLKGVQNNTQVTLVHASAGEESNFLAGMVGMRIENTNTYLEENSYPYLLVGNSTKVAIQIDQVAKTISFLYLDGSQNVVQQGSRFTFSSTGMMLAEQIQLGNLSFNEVFWDPLQQNFYVQGGSQKVMFQSGDVPVIPLVHALGFLHQYVIVDPSVNGYQAKLPAAFLDIYNAAKEGVYNVGDYQLELIAFSLLFDQSNRVYMDYYISNSTGNYRARYTYTMSVNNANKVTFNFVSQDGNAQVINPGLTPLLNYFKNNTFTLDYYQDPDFGSMAGFYPEQTPAAFFYGFLE